MSKAWQHIGRDDAASGRESMIAVGSGRKWQGLSQEDRQTVQRVFAEVADALVASYAEIDARYLAELKGTDVPVVSVGKGFFGDAVDSWYVAWREKASMLKDLETEAASLRFQPRPRGNGPPTRVASLNACRII